MVEVEKSAGRRGTLRWHVPGSDCEVRTRAGSQDVSGGGCRRGKKRCRTVIRTQGKPGRLRTGRRGNRTLHRGRSDLADGRSVKGSITSVCAREREECETQKREHWKLGLRPRDLKVDRRIHINHQIRELPTGPLIRLNPARNDPETSQEFGVASSLSRRLTFRQSSGVFIESGVSTFYIATSSRLPAYQFSTLFASAGSSSSLKHIIGLEYRKLYCIVVTHVSVE